MTNITSLNFNYFSCKSELCDIGAKFDTDKSSQRKNVTDIRHCHPYTLFYDSLFKNNKNDSLQIAELGIEFGSSLLMWEEYFPNSKIYGFEYDETLIHDFKQKHSNKNITLWTLDVTNRLSISNAFRSTGIKYDIIIDDTTHQFEDQIRVIENTCKYLKPGGILIIEDVFKSYSEKKYIDKLKPILHNFKDFYFVSLDHNRRNSTGWDNDKLFVLIKNGEPIFKNKNKITIITPSCRIGNLETLKESINFNYVNEWIIVYDENLITKNPNLFEKDTKIKEYVCKGDDWGNSQRNYALDRIEDINTYVYFLDDDNIIHPDFYKLLNLLDDKKIYTFNQELASYLGNNLYNFNCPAPFVSRTQENRLGNNIKVCNIDTAQFLINYSLCKNNRWKLNTCESDGFFIEECYNLNKNSWIYVDNNLCYNSIINSNTPGKTWICVRNDKDEIIGFKNRSDIPVDKNILLEKTWINVVDLAFNHAEQNISKISQEIIDLEGMSGLKTQHFYNNLLEMNDARYLEIGVWKGSTVCAAMYGNKAKVTCIDNWSEFGGPKEEFLINFNKFKGLNDAFFIEQDCFATDVSTLGKYNIYMYDGNHDIDNHYRALSHFYDCLDDIFIYIVDDWNWLQVREGTMSAINNLKLNILFEKAIRLTNDNSTTYSKDTWWNGIYVAVLQKKNDIYKKQNQHY